MLQAYLLDYYVHNDSQWPDIIAFHFLNKWGLRCWALGICFPLVR